MDSQHNVEIKPYATVFIYSTPEGVFGSRVVDFFFFFQGGLERMLDYVDRAGLSFEIRQNYHTHIYIYIYIYMCVCVDYFACILLFLPSILLFYYYCRLFHLGSSLKNYALLFLWSPTLKAIYIYIYISVAEEQVS